MTVDSYRVNQVGAPVTAGMLDVVSVLGRVNWSLSTRCATIDLANAFFSVP